MKNQSFFVVLLLSILFSFEFSTSINDFKKGNQTCICAYDGFGYYMYLPSLFHKNTLNIQKEWAQNIQDEYCNKTEVYQLIQQKNGNNINLYHMGLSYIQLPSYSISHFFAKILGYRTDGFSFPFVIGFFLNALLFCIIGIIYTRKLLLLFFKDQTVSLLLIILYLATNSFITFTLQKDLPHLYLFAINSAFLYHLFTYRKKNIKRHLLYASILLGLTVAIRPTQILLGIIPLVILWKEKENFKSFFKNISYFPLFGIFWNIPQILYWYFIGGELFIPNLHVEEIIIVDPNLIDFLFSYRKGWLLYSPVFLLSFIGFYILYKKEKLIFTSLFTTLIVYIYIMSSWECWWYASSFGSRVMTDIYPLTIIPIGFLWESITKKEIKFFFLTFCFLATALNLIQSYQLKIGILHHERMSKQQYFYIFGKLNLPNFNENRLLMNRKDVKWIESIKDEPYYTIEKDIPIFEAQQLRFDKKRINSGIKNIILLDKIKSDETRIDIDFEVRFIKAKSSPIYLKVETCSAYNCYNWQNIELKQDSTSTQFKKIHYSFNLPDINHREDKLQIYVTNENETEFEFRNFKITGTTVLRK